MTTAVIPLTLAIHPNWPLLWLSSLDGIEYLRRADESKFLLVAQHWYTHV